MKYRNDPKFLDRYAWQTVEQPESTLFAVPSASFGCINI